ncbi:hypothetical protein EA462_00985 [Natrarchaeobius halalkaliphilus]|uniref:Site-specific integrase n=1 Tax=Natrarchaeobius halalkaliphilus TaxID=1679091 RepID=A0A3N6LSD9_9EURY|nr:tyrosine-type recombinase/integrase [Natrarchaeobius halalkaliphilus]RQG92833.1 hypothetical protein EA462_00985 [Natrarchaeobius halalkaliphilus]
MGLSAGSHEGQSVQCPVYEQARQNPEWQDLLSGPVCTEPKCGHLINRVVNKAGYWSDSTIRKYCYAGSHYIIYLHDQGKTTCDAEYEDVERFFAKLSKRKLRKNTYMNYRTAINHIYTSIALSPDHHSYLSAQKINEWLNLEELPTRKQLERESLSEEEVEKLFEELTCFRDRLMAQSAIEWGGRNESLRALKTSDVNLGTQIVRLKNTKSGGTYPVPISDKLTMLLRHWINVERKAYLVSSENDYLFPSRRGGSLSGTSFSEMVREAAEEAGIQKVIGTIKHTERQKEAFGKEKRNFYRVTPHALRHTFNELLRARGIPREVRSDALDHSSTDVTKEFYEHSTENYHSQIRRHFSDMSF